MRGCRVAFTLLPETTVSGVKFRDRIADGLQANLDVRKWVAWILFVLERKALVVLQLPQFFQALVSVQVSLAEDAELLSLLSAPPVRS